MQLPSYQSHKIVQAAKIESVSEPDNDGVTTLGLGWLGVQFVERDWFAAHSPEVGGYFVRYNDGYTSYSPAEEFENGYKPVTEFAWAKDLAEQVAADELSGMDSQIPDDYEGDTYRRQCALGHAVAVCGSSSRPEEVLEAARAFDLFLSGAPNPQPVQPE